MRAAAYDRYGSPDVLYLAQVDRPSPGAGEVLVRVEASTVNGGELMGRQGRLRLVTGRRFPQRTGIDLVGAVVELGSGVDDLRIGERVWGAVDERGGRGTAADYVAVPRAKVAAAPATLSPVEASSLLAGGSTALVALRDVVRLAPGEHLLVRGGAGGVGSVAVQVGRMLGAHVTALASRSGADFVRSLGAEEVIDYRTPLSALGRYDVVLDTRGSSLHELRRHLTGTGRMVTITADLDHLVRSAGTILTSTVHGSRRVRLFLGRPDSAVFAELTAAVARGDLRPVVDQVFPLDQIAAAHARLEAGGVLGKVVVDHTR
jgi:NADPH:quinone reductase-like Zn-dependent oxidoreductase